MAIQLTCIGAGFHFALSSLGVQGSPVLQQVMATIVTLFLGIVLLLLGALFAFHTFLACTGQTSKQFFSFKQPEHHSKSFSGPCSGVIKNIGEFCCGDACMITPSNIAMPLIKHIDMVCDNRYFSCC